MVHLAEEAVRPWTTTAGVRTWPVRLLTTAPDRPSPAGPGGPLDANCSASGDLGVVAVGHACRVGVDVEEIVPWSGDTPAEGWLTVDEEPALRCLPVDERAVAATRCWTQKEAVLEARGTGLLDDPCTVGTSVRSPSGVVAGWAVADLPVPRGWVASLASGPLEEEPS